MALVFGTYLTFSAGRSYGEEYTALDFLNFCERKDHSICSAYLAGLLDMNASFQGKGATGFFCLPADGIRAEQAVLIFKKWAHDHPEELHKSDLYGATAALMAAFPCQ
jgi:hypothetical protein